MPGYLYDMCGAANTAGLGNGSMCFPTPFLFFFLIPVHVCACPFLSNNRYDKQFADWYSILNSVDPWFYAMVGPGMALVLSIIGAAWSVSVSPPEIRLA